MDIAKQAVSRLYNRFAFFGQRKFRRVFFAVRSLKR